MSRRRATKNRNAGGRPIRNFDMTSEYEEVLRRRYHEDLRRAKREAERETGPLTFSREEPDA